jgi:putative FmdB family regulatory protein
MPIYEFECEKCGTCFEEILPANRTEMPACPQCARPDQVRKRISACARPAPASGSAGQGCAPRSGFS